MTGDGVADLVVGSEPGAPNRVRVYDGATGSPWSDVTPFEASFAGGVWVSAGDLDGDGVAEVAASPGLGGGPRVRVFSPLTGEALADFFGIDDPSFRGGARTAMTDINGDGAADLIVAAGRGGGPRVTVYNGSGLAEGLEAKLVGDFFAFEEELSDGAFVAGGDLDGDGRGDLILGAGPGGGPRVRVVSGLDLMSGGPGSASGRLVPDFFAGSPDDREGVAVSAVDVDRDGQADLIAWPGTAGGEAVVYTGDTLNDGAPKRLTGLGGSDDGALEEFVGRPTVQ